jgi:uncharacterized protein YdaU (DUF1376 family)
MSIKRRKHEVAKNPVEWVKYHSARMGFLLTTRLQTQWSAHGAASILIHHYLARGEPLPDDEAKLALLAGGTAERWQEVSAIVRSLFHVEDDGMLHQREYAGRGRRIFGDKEERWQRRRQGKSRKRQSRFDA